MLLCNFTALTACRLSSNGVEMHEWLINYELERIW
jgi:hypothetical protein